MMDDDEEEESNEQPIKLGEHFMKDDRYLDDDKDSD